MKKFLYLLAVVFCISIVSCEKDGVGSKKQLVGTWQGVMAIDEEYGETDYAEPGEYILCFKSNGSGYQQTYDKIEYNFKWTLKGTQLHLSGLEPVTVKKLTNKELVISSADGFTQYYERLK